eukprot:7636857-Pyramimonas_sp.AAC.1
MAARQARKGPHGHATRAHEEGEERPTCPQAEERPLHAPRVCVSQATSRPSSLVTVLEGFREHRDQAGD